MDPTLCLFAVSGVGSAGAALWAEWGGEGVDWEGLHEGHAEMVGERSVLGESGGGGRVSGSLRAKKKKEGIACGVRGASAAGAEM
jgi:hypothetical protein